MLHLTHRQIIPAIPESLGRARDSVQALLEANSVAPVNVSLNDILLVVTELLTNAIRHARPPIEFVLSVEGAAVTIQVIDHSPEEHPTRLPLDPLRIGGWGLVIVADLAEEWGVVQGADHKVVWARLSG